MISGASRKLPRVGWGIPRRYLGLAGLLPEMWTQYRLITEQETVPCCTARTWGLRVLWRLSIYLSIYLSARLAYVERRTEMNRHIGLCSFCWQLANSPSDFLPISNSFISADVCWCVCGTPDWHLTGADAGLNSVNVTWQQQSEERC